MAIPVAIDAIAADAIAADAIAAPTVLWVLAVVIAEAVGHVMETTVTAPNTSPTDRGLEHDVWIDSFCTQAKANQCNVERFFPPPSRLS